MVSGVLQVAGLERKNGWPLAEQAGEGLVGTAGGDAAGPVRVFISYAHESDEHVERVRDLWIFLRARGIDAKLDRVAAQRRQDWALWMGDPDG